MRDAWQRPALILSTGAGDSLPTMTAALAATIVGVFLTFMLGTIGWLIKARLSDIAQDIHDVSVKLDGMPLQLFDLDKRITRLEDWRKTMDRRRDLSR